jgi:isoleucyl-tRNA synthetase
MKNFKEVDARMDFVEMEKRTLNWWNENGIQKKYFEKNKNSDKRFGFTDGPITANNPMGLHHAWGRTYKDVVSRYKNMQGFDQRFQMGFDCQGLWVEVEVEKALGFNSKKDIYDYGMGKFTDACKERVMKFSKIQTEQSIRLGMFMDWDNSYYTMSQENNLYIWHFLKKAKEMGLLYKNYSATTWCPRCETGLSEHEKADGYKEVVDTSVFVKFEIEGRKNEYLLAWTTTPWTLSANVLLAVNPRFQYVKVVEGENTYYLAAKPAKKLNFKNVEPVDVKELVGLKFNKLYDIPAQEGVEHYVVEWDQVSEDDGTGIVHIAPGCGGEDYELGLSVGSAVVSPLTQSGHYMEGYGDLTGKYAHDVKDEVLEFLKSKDLLFKTEDYKHQYPHCWRCRTKCLFRLENNWFINLDKIRQELKEQANVTEWVPDYAGKRMQDWLKNMGDWMISRKRFYGLSLPFYECSCGELTVVGGKEELKSLAVKPEMVDALPSLHRPWIDEIEIKCPKCGANVKRVEDVGDCWLDAGVVPFSTTNYLDNKEVWEKWFPADFVVESIEQVRLWFYSMLVFGTVLEGKVPYAKALAFAEMRDDHNDKMSKTKKNYIPYDDAADKAGSDLIRFNFCLSPFGKNIMFGWRTMDELKRQFLLPLWNSYVYFGTYAKMCNWEYKENFVPTDVMDKWALASLQNLVNEVTKSMDEYKFNQASSLIQEYVVELSTWFIRRSRDRFKNGDTDAVQTLYMSLVTLSKLLAPFTPFLSEEMYQNLVVNMGIKGALESVHLEDFPQVVEFDTKVLEDMKTAREVASLGLKIRDTSRIKLRQPLAKVYLHLKDEVLQEIVKSELNVKSVEYADKPVKGDGLISMESGSTFVTLDTNITEELKLEGAYREFVRGVQDLRKQGGLQVGQQVGILFETDESTKKLMSGYVDNLKKDLSARDITFAKVEGESVDFNDSEVKVKFEI